MSAGALPVRCESGEVLIIARRIRVSRVDQSIHCRYSCRYRHIVTVLNGPATDTDSDDSAAYRKLLLGVGQVMVNGADLERWLESILARLVARDSHPGAHGQPIDIVLSGIRAAADRGGTVAATRLIALVDYSAAVLEQRDQVAHASWFRAARSERWRCAADGSAA